MLRSVLRWVSAIGYLGAMTVDAMLLWRPSTNYLGFTFEGGCAIALALIGVGVTCELLVWKFCPSQN